MLYEARQKTAALRKYKLVMYLIIPLLLIVIYVSQYVSQSSTAHIFSSLDANNDGMVTVKELERYYTNVLHRKAEFG